MTTEAHLLLEELRGELAEVEQAIRSHRFLAALEHGRVPRERLAALAGEQQLIISSDRRSFTVLAARFPEPPAGELFLSLAEGESIALDLLAPFAAALGVGTEALRVHEPAPAAQAYPACLAWLAINGSRAEASLAMLANLEAWGANCARAERALTEQYGLEARTVEFFGFFARPPAELGERLLATVTAGLAEGDSPVRARRAARMLQAYELLFWDAMAEGIS